jgi:uncharacterized membrane protein
MPANGSGTGIGSAPRDTRSSRGVRTMAVIFSAAIRTSGWAYSSSNVDGGADGAVSGRVGGALDSTVLNDAAATQGHDHPARSVIASARRPLPAAGSSHTRVGRRS